jgi:hypothetical protein
LTHAHRIHAPVITNEKITSSVGSETLSIPECEIYEINNGRPHSVRNDSEETGVYLVLDYVLKNEKCCCGGKYRPDTPCSPEVCRDSDLGRVPCTCWPEST